MKKPDFQYWLSILANVGVIAGIVFLALEVNQNTIAIRAQVYQSNTENLIENIGMVVEPQTLLSALEKMEYTNFRCTPDPELYNNLTNQEKIVATEYFTLHWLRLRNNIFQYEEGTLSRDNFEQTTLPTISEYYHWLNIFSPPNAELALDILNRYSAQEPQEPLICAN